MSKHKDLVRFRQGSLSGKWNADRDQWFAVLDFFAADGVDWIDLTEAGTGHVPAILAEWAARTGGWTVHQLREQPGQAENAILTRDATVETRRTRARLLTDKRLRTARDTPLWATSVQARPKVDGVGVGRWIRLQVTHLPAHVERPSGVGTDWAGQVWRACVAGWARIARRWAGPAVIRADWNISIRREEFRTMVADRFPGLRLAFDGNHLPDRGTHGRRIIDFSLTNLLIARFTRVVCYMPGFDHALTRTDYWVAV